MFATNRLYAFNTPVDVFSTKAIGVFSPATLGPFRNILVITSMLFLRVLLSKDVPPGKPVTWVTED